MADENTEGGANKKRAFDVRRFCERYLAEDHCALLGLRYLADGPGGHVELELPYNPALAGDSEGPADGAIMGLLDMAGTIAVWSRIDGFRPHATINIRVDHLAPAPPVLIRAAVDCLHIDERLVRIGGAAFAGDAVIAGFAATYAFTDVR